MKPHSIEDKISEHYQKRNLVWPGAKNALLWATTELGEAIDILMQREGGWVRNNPDAKRSDLNSFAEELADILLMVRVAGMSLGIHDLDDIMLSKMERKLNAAKE